MKILLIGHSVVDFIHEPGRMRNQPGGLFYSAAALASWKDKNDLIALCTMISDDSYNFFYDVYEKLDQRFLQRAAAVPKIHLTIHENREREERYENISNKIFIPYERLNDFDGILINMITGFEISVEDIQTVRKSFNGLIYFDVHSLARGLDENLKREFRPVENFSEWARCIDVLQANENEFMTLSSSSNSIIEIAKNVLYEGVKIILLTKGEAGARAFFLRDNELESVFIPSIKIKPINKVGCGDVFGSLFFYNYLAAKDLQNSLRTANCGGGVVASSLSTSQLQNLKLDVNRKLSE